MFFLTPASEDFSEERLVFFSSDVRAKAAVDVPHLMSAWSLQRLQNTRLPRISSEEAPLLPFCAVFLVVAASIKKESICISPRIVPRTAQRRSDVRVAVWVTT